MTETRMNEIKIKAEEIIGALADVQQAVMHHPKTSTDQEFKTDLYERITGIKATAESLKRKDVRCNELDPMEAMVIRLTNSTNSYKHAINRGALRGGVKGMSNGEILMLAHLAGQACNLCNNLLSLREQQGESGNAAA